MAKRLADLGLVKEMTISRPVWNFGPLGEPLAKVENMKFTKTRVDCKVKFNEDGWTALRKACARKIKIHLDEKMPGVRKGETITVAMTDGTGSRKITGVLYHVRKPYRDSEARVYYIREEFSGIA